MPAEAVRLLKAATGLVSILTVTMPVVAAKKLLFWLVAVELVEPHVPLIFFDPPNVREPALMFSPFPMLAKAPEAILRLADIDVPALIVFIPEPKRPRLV